MIRNYIAVFIALFYAALVCGFFYLGVNNLLINLTMLWCVLAIITSAPFNHESYPIVEYGCLIGAMFKILIFINIFLSKQRQKS